MSAAREYSRLAREEDNFSINPIKNKTMTDQITKQLGNLASTAIKIGTNLGNALNDAIDKIIPPTD